MKRSEYRVPKMDCAAEERMVRGALEGMDGLVALEFDLAARKLAVVHTGDVDAVSARLAPLGLGASLLQSGEASGAVTALEDSAGEKRTLYLLLVINGAMFAAEFGAGLIAASAGLIADALDMLADALVYGVALWAVGRAPSAKLRAAHLSGWLQLALAAWALLEVARRFIFGSEPEPAYMMTVAFAALLANVACLWLVSGQRHRGAHMKASWIFSSNDVIASAGVIAAGAFVAWTGSRIPDLVVGALIAAVVVSGALRILRLRS